MRIRKLGHIIGIPFAHASLFDVGCITPEWRHFDQKVTQFFSNTSIPFTIEDIPSRSFSRQYDPKSCVRDDDDCEAAELFLMGLGGITDEEWRTFDIDWWALVQSPFPLFKYWSKIWPYENLDHRTAEGVIESCDCPNVAFSRKEIFTRLSGNKSLRGALDFSLLSCAKTKCPFVAATWFLTAAAGAFSRAEAKSLVRYAQDRIGHISPTNLVKPSEDERFPWPYMWLLQRIAEIWPASPIETNKNNLEQEQLANETEKVVEEFDKQLLQQVAENTNHPEHRGCFIMVYAKPQKKVKRDARAALSRLHDYFIKPKNVSYPIVVFTDQETVDDGEFDQLQQITTARIVPAVIPDQHMYREMDKYVCPISNASWPPNYIRMSRYTAGPMFEHPALDECSHFFKIDTDFFLDQTVTVDPLYEMWRHHRKLGWWQVHIQTRRQEHYMDFMDEFMQMHQTPVRNAKFYSKLNLETLKLGGYDGNAAFLIYGCLFGGEVEFFRSGSYRTFFDYIDSLRGFEKWGWSNQFLLATAAALFLQPRYLSRVMFSGRHQSTYMTMTKNQMVYSSVDGGTRLKMR